VATDCPLGFTINGLLGKNHGKLQISWEKRWFPGDFSTNSLKPGCVLKQLRSIKNGPGQLRRANDAAEAVRQWCALWGSRGTLELLGGNCHGINGWHLE